MQCFYAYKIMLIYDSKRTSYTHHTDIYSVMKKMNWEYSIKGTAE